MLPSTPPKQERHKRSTFLSVGLHEMHPPLKFDVDISDSFRDISPVKSSLNLNSSPVLSSFTFRPKTIYLANINQRQYNDVHILKITSGFGI